MFCQSTNWDVLEFNIIRVLTMFFSCCPGPCIDLAHSGTAVLGQVPRSQLPPYAKHGFRVILHFVMLPVGSGCHLYSTGRSFEGFQGSISGLGDSVY